MKKSFCLVLAMVLICVFSIQAVWAAEAKKQDVKLDAKQQEQLAKEVELFSGVAFYAETYKDAFAMISAIKMFDQLPVEGIAKPGVDGKSAEKYDRAAMVKQAKEYAAGDQEVLAVIAKIEEAPKATAVRGRHNYHRGYHGNHGYHGRYYGHRHHCVMIRICDPFGCVWRCR